MFNLLQDILKKNPDEEIKLAVVAALPSFVHDYDHAELVYNWIIKGNISQPQGKIETKSNKLIQDPFKGDNAKYHLKLLIGEGTFAKVYLAKQVSDGKLFAIKTM